MSVKTLCSDLATIFTSNGQFDSPRIDCVIVGPIDSVISNSLMIDFGSKEGDSTYENHCF